MKLLMVLNPELPAEITLSSSVTYLRYFPRLSSWKWRAKMQSISTIISAEVPKVAVLLQVVYVTGMDSRYPSQ